MDPVAFAERGWTHADSIPGLDTWLAHAVPHAERLIAAPENARWLRAGGTWYAGVNLLNNDARGACPGGPPLPRALLDAITACDAAPFEGWDTAQLSVVYPHYPRRDPDESEASHAFRRNRDAAHVDGLHAVGPARRRHANEHHAFVLGLPWTPAPDGASALAVWEGSHRLMRERLAAALDGLDPADWPSVDLTEAYQAARRAVFEACPRVEVQAPVGGAYLVHRLAVHGISPWRADAAEGARRAVAYFRPALTNAGDWLAA
ncbi:MAG: hypothetical protein AAGA11_20745 [Pseudomonadota bacterium]